ncbi:MFS transporter [Solirhodobacter olei]|uniref:MFS transporter n=1 Tax=Solirhodobacter olei TaxID=2493082 RepID=UPI000FD917A8|nr:MFS transporter [Solirhodobacter olei]
MPAEPAQRRLLPALQILAIWAAGLGAAAQFGKISLAYGRFAAAYPGQGPVAMGFMVSIVGLVGLALGTTAGLLVERAGLRRTLIAGLLLGAVLSALEAFLPPYPVMMALRAAEGLSQLAIVVAGPVLIAQIAPLRWQGLAMSLWATFFGVSFALTALVVPGILALGGLQALLLAHAGWLTFFAMLLWPMLPADARGGRALRLVELPGLHAAIYRSPSVAAPAAGFVFYTVTYVALLTLLPPLAGAGREAVAFALPLVSIIASLSLGVWLIRRVGAVRVVQGGFALGLLAVLAMRVFWGEPGVAFGAILVLGAALGLVQGASFAAIPELNAAPEDRARAAGAVAQLGNLGTASGTPILAALIAGLGINGAVVFVAPLCVAGIAMHAWMAARRRRSAV